MTVLLYLSHCETSNRPRNVPGLTFAATISIINRLENPADGGHANTKMTSFLCSNCGVRLRVPAGKQHKTSGRCPRCNKSIEAPNHESDADETAHRPDSGEARFSVADDDESRLSELQFLAPPQGPDEIGRLGKFRILKILGSGGMGVVLLAEDARLRRQVALKVMRKAQAANPIQRQRFLREAEAAAALDHDHIVPIYEVDESNGVPYLAMKLLVGETLEERLNRQGRLKPDEIIRIAQETAEGLATAHERGLVHRDIKPANIFLEEGKDRVKILDFGLVQTRDEDVRLTQENFLLGTPAYMSPEQASGDQPTDHRTDLFSLGSVLYRMATGELPFKGRTALNVLTALATRRPRPPADVQPDVPKPLSDLIMHLLEKSPERRPKSARAVIAALEDLKNTLQQEEEEEPVEVDVVEQEDEPAETEPERPRPRPRRPISRPRGPRRETTEERLARRAINFAIWSGILVFLLLAYLIVRNTFFRPSDDKPTPKVEIKS